MGQQVGITEDYARYVLAEFDKCIEDVKSYAKQYKDIGDLTWMGNALGSLPDGLKRRSILEKSGQTFLKWVADQIEHLQKMRDRRAEVFDLYYGTDWSSKQDLSNVHIPEPTVRGY